MAKRYTMPKAKPSGKLPRQATKHTPEDPAKAAAAANRKRKR